MDADIGVGGVAFGEGGFDIFLGLGHQGGERFDGAWGGFDGDIDRGNFGIFKVGGAVFFVLFGFSGRGGFVLHFGFRGGGCGRGCERGRFGVKGGVGEEEASGGEGDER